MNLNLSQEQSLLVDSVDRFISRDYGFGSRKKTVESATRINEEVWVTMVELGWLGLSLPELHGGYGGSAVDVGIVMQGLGKGLVLEPFVSTVLLCGGLIALAGSDAQRTLWIPRIASGGIKLAFAHPEQGTDFESFALQTRAKKVDNGWRLYGKKSWVVDAPSANWLLVSATVSEEDRTKVALFLVPQDSDRLRRLNFEIVDGRLASHLEFDGVLVSETDRLGGGEDASDAITETLDRANAAMCSEAVGCMQVLLADTVAYSKTRMQFGQPLSANQVLRHRMVDMAVQCEEARVISLRACLHIGHAHVARSLAVSGAKLKVARAGRYIAESAIQIHGAMGVTEELSVGSYAKRLMSFEMMFGTTRDHQRRVCVLRNDTYGSPTIA